MNCRRSEELLSDYLEHHLAPPLANEMRAHLDRCDGCRDLLASLREALDLLKALEVPEPPEDLTERILAHTRPALEQVRRRKAPAVVSSLPLGYGWLTAAAVLVLVLLWWPSGPVSSVGRRTSQAVHQTYSLGVRTFHRGERWLDELDMLRMTVAVAFEDRLDLLNERLRALQKASRRSDDESPESSRAVGSDQSRV